MNLMYYGKNELKNSEEVIEPWPSYAHCHYCGGVDFKSNSQFAFTCTHCNQINTRNSIESGVGSPIFVQLSFGDILKTPEEFESDLIEVNRAKITEKRNS